MYHQVRRLRKHIKEMHSAFLVCLLVCFYSMQRCMGCFGGVCACERMNQCFPLSQTYSGIHSFTLVFPSQLWYWSCFRPVGFLASPSPGSRRLCSPASAHLLLVAPWLQKRPCPTNPASLPPSLPCECQGELLHFSSNCQTQAQLHGERYWPCAITSCPLIKDRLSRGTVFLSQTQTFSTQSALSCQSLSSALDVDTSRAP